MFIFYQQDSNNAFVSSWVLQMGHILAGVSKMIEWVKNVSPSAEME